MLLGEVPGGRERGERRGGGAGEHSGGGKLSGAGGALEPVPEREGVRREGGAGGGRRQLRHGGGARRDGLWGPIHHHRCQEQGNNITLSVPPTF